MVAKMEAGLLDPAPIWTDLRTFPWGRFRGGVGILSGGFPCQPFSAAGKRVGDEDPRHLFPHILRGVIECNPDLVFLENVEGIISAKLSGGGWRDPAGTPVLLHVLRELERVGYRATAGIFSSAEVGATHQRKRVFILAVAHHHQRLEGQWGPVDLNGAEGWQDAVGQSTARGMASRPDRPLPPGPDQWWWEPSRVIHDSTRVANRHGQFIEKARSVADTGRRQCNRRSVSAGSIGTAQSVTGEAGDTRDPDVGNAAQRNERGEQQRGMVARLQANQERQANHDESNGSSQADGEDVAHDTCNRWRERWTQSSGQQGGLDAAECGQPDVGHTDVLQSCGQQRTGYHQAGHTGEGALSREGALWGTDGKVHRQAKPSLGGNPDGAPHWVDYTELCQTVDSRVDELRLLGNGVDPDVAHRAFVTLYSRLCQPLAPTQ